MVTASNTMVEGRRIRAGPHGIRSKRRRDLKTMGFPRDHGFHVVRWASTQGTALGSVKAALMADGVTDRPPRLDSTPSRGWRPRGVPARYSRRRRAREPAALGADSRCHTSWCAAAEGHLSTLEQLVDWAIHLKPRKPRSNATAPASTGAIRRSCWGVRSRRSGVLARPSGVCSPPLPVHVPSERRQRRVLSPPDDRC